jgi:penicillin-binding protein 1C
MNPFEPNGRTAAIGRGRRILDLLQKNGVISRDERDLARRQIGSLVVPPAGERPEEALHAVLRLARDSSAWKAEKREVVETTLDLDLQALVESEMDDAVRAWEAEGAHNAAVIVIDRETAEVLAWGGSTGYFDKGRTGAIDYTSVSRSPGSTLKPFLVAHALDRGVITPSTILDDIERGPGGIGNADDAFLGPMLPRSALANSRNVPAAQLVARLGVDETYGYLRELKLHDGREPARRYGLGLAIGGLPTTLERLVRAYTAVARDGRMVELRWRLDDPLVEKRVMSEEAARLVTLFLSDPQARLPTFPRGGALEYPFGAAIKTETSSRFRDAWAVGWTGRHLVGAWVRFERELEARVRRRAGYALLVLRRTLTKGATHDPKETALRARALRPARSVAGFS